jgi:hypothetical protein
LLIKKFVFPLQPAFERVRLSVEFIRFRHCINDGKVFECKSGLETGLASEDYSPLLGKTTEKNKKIKSDIYNGLPL